MTARTLIAQSLTDLAEDFEELDCLASSNIKRLQKFLKTIDSLRNKLPKQSVEIATGLANKLSGDYSNLRARIAAVQKNLPFTLPTVDAVNALARQKDDEHHILRSHQGILGSILTSADWQSPSFLHSAYSQAGSQTGRIYATINDYKRDQHWDAHEYERLFIKEYVDSFIKFPINAYATSSGMAAFTTILSYLMLEKRIAGPVVIGRNIYFENKDLVTKAFGNQLIEVDESDTHAVCEAIKSHQPSVILFDSLTNAPGVTIPDLPRILGFCVKWVKRECFFVVDNTSLSVFFQPLPLIQGRFSKIRIIVFESLNKYHQFGLDRVTGGIIWSYGGDTIKLFDYREHLGTNIADSSVASLPTPNRKLLTRRFMRHQRNATLMVKRLQSFIDDHSRAPFARIVYPGMGSFFVIEVKPQYRTIRFYKRVISRIIAVARRQNVAIVSGTSFGLNTTRIYLTAVRYRAGIPFLRVSVGTEHRLEIETIGEVFVKSFQSFY